MIARRQSPKHRSKPPSARRLKLAPCRLDLASLAARNGLDIEELIEAKASLVRSRVLIEMQDGKVAINGAYREWIFPETGKPRLTEQMIRDIRRRES